MHIQIITVEGRDRSTDMLGYLKQLQEWISELTKTYCALDGNKAVHSAVRAASRNRTPMAPGRPTTVKCWIFKA